MMNNDILECIVLIQELDQRLNGIARQNGIGVENPLIDLVKFRAAMLDHFKSTDKIDVAETEAALINESANYNVQITPDDK